MPPYVTPKKSHRNSKFSMEVDVHQNLLENLIYVDGIIIVTSQSYF